VTFEPPLDAATVSCLTDAWKRVKLATAAKGTLVYLVSFKPEY